MKSERARQCELCKLDAMIKMVEKERRVYISKHAFAIQLEKKCHCGNDFIGSLREDRCSRCKALDRLQMVAGPKKVVVPRNVPVMSAAAFQDLDPIKIARMGKLPLLVPVG